MKKIGFKKRAQWGFYKAALFGVFIAVLLAPTVRDFNERTDYEKNSTKEKTENAIDSFLGNLSFGEKTKIIMNGEVVAVCRGQDEAGEAVKAARLACNRDGIRLMHVDVSYAPVNEEKDSEQIRKMKVKRGEELTEEIMNKFLAYDDKKQLAYTMRIDDYTVTVENFQDLVSILEQTQSRYDKEDHFQVNLALPASRNVTMYEVGVSEKNQPNAEGEASNLEDTGEESASTQETAEEPDEQLKAQARDDGVKYVGFTEKIQVMETYVGKDQIKDKDTAYAEITEEKGEDSIYVVKSGDYLDLIAEKTNMTVEQIKELNPGIESDENLYYDDRLNITVPRATVQIMVKKQETYKETYHEDIVYEDDDSMFIGETEVLEEGAAGKHIVTDLVTYNGDIESNREQLAETVEVAAVAQVVRRGTKSRPTYMYPVTNWNVTSVFGYRWGRLHAGTDVGIPTGTTVRASRSGQVTVAGWAGGYGNCVMIDHGDGITTVYGHLSEINCSVGQYVDQGQQIALSGNTGRSTGPHLHFEIRVNGVAEDATPYLEGQR